jgi:hypothetical protein
MPEQLKVTVYIGESFAEIQEELKRFRAQSGDRSRRLLMLAAIGLQALKQSSAPISAGALSADGYTLESAKKDSESQSSPSTSRAQGSAVQRMRDKIRQDLGGSS